MGRGVMGNGDGWLPATVWMLGFVGGVEPLQLGRLRSRLTSPDLEESVFLSTCEYQIDTSTRVFPVFYSYIHSGKILCWYHGRFGFRVSTPGECLLSFTFGRISAWNGIWYVIRNSHQGGLFFSLFTPDLCNSRYRRDFA